MEFKQNEKKRRAAMLSEGETTNKTERLGLWFGLTTAALATLFVLALAFYNYYQDNKSANEALAVTEITGEVRINENEVASMALVNGEEQAKGMTAPADSGTDEQHTASDVAVASVPAHPATVILADNDVGVDEAKVVVENGVVKFYFASGKAELADNVLNSLKEIVQGVKEGRKAVVSGFADSSGNAELNTRLSKERAFKVRDALLAAGIPESSIEMKKPENSIGSGAKDEARRVEVVLQ